MQDLRLPLSAWGRGHVCHQCGWNRWCQGLNMLSHLPQESNRVFNTLLIKPSHPGAKVLYRKLLTFRIEVLRDMENWNISLNCHAFYRCMFLLQTNICENMSYVKLFVMSLTSLPLLTFDITYQRTKHVLL